MSDKQKVLFKQLQLSGLGLVICAMGMFKQNQPFIIVGACLFVYGIIRYFVIKKLTQNLEEDE